MIIMTGFAGHSGTMKILKENRDKLLERFSKGFLDSIPVCNPEAETALTKKIIRKRGVETFLEAGRDGIFAALWEFGVLEDCGMRIDTCAIPMLQETIETADQLDINPYEDDSTGCVIFIQNGETADAIISELRKNDINAAVIGYETRDKDRLLIKGEERRFLTPASRIEAEKKQRETFRCKTR